MTTPAMLSIVKQGQTYQLRYAASHPYAPERQAYGCPDEESLRTFLASCALDTWEVRQAFAALRHGRMAVVPLGQPLTQVETYFPVRQGAHDVPGVA